MNTAAGSIITLSSFCSSFELINLEKLFNFSGSLPEVDFIMSCYPELFDSFRQLSLRSVIASWSYGDCYLILVFIWMSTSKLDPPVL